MIRTGGLVGRIDPSGAGHGMATIDKATLAAALGHFGPSEHAAIISDAAERTMTGALYTAQPTEEGGLQVVLDYWERDAGGTNTIFPILRLTARPAPGGLAVTAIGADGDEQHGTAEILALARRAAAFAARIAEGHVDDLPRLAAEAETV